MKGIASVLFCERASPSVFYTSGKASLETSHMFGLFGRLCGHSSFPDSSNMCHETISVGLKKVIGSAVGTCVLEDFDHCDAIFYFGQNPGTNSPHFLHPRQDAVKRGCKISTFNLVRKAGLVHFADLQNPVQMLIGHSTDPLYMYLQLRSGGDIAVLMGLCNQVLAVDDSRQAAGQPDVLTLERIAEHTEGLEVFAASVQATDWAEIESVPGPARADIEQAPGLYIAAKRVIGVYGMGLTQHVHGTQTMRLFVKLLLRGNSGRQGAGMSLVRRHSSVQGQRTVGISEKPELVSLHRLAEIFDFEPPRDTALNTVDACNGILDGSVQGFVSLGSNFVRAIPEHEAIEKACLCSRCCWPPTPPWGGNKYVLQGCG